MLISKENRKTIYETLFREGVLIAKKDFNAPKHGELDLPNLEVIKACQSLTSRGFVKTQFSWQYYYYTLTNEGIEYLREYLHLPAEIVPSTHKRAPRPAEARAPRPERRQREGGDREYRKKEGAAPGEFNPSFRGGIGRGQRPQEA
ncbi:hypothetical protein SAICODRAFT_67455 [Saitoella complicata NRRL Y-17804]|uniref:uncharacterized protein n=1 Tax=Saitoella complicata (strain BCRC 22490 / CBS 7301 / JCM 7358 / NBRC 10748 / NRRL Y-17804) TaxID=698492 RepID=UPI0008671701|nr:uncharacterized protein SAICODRAFT_67455 [Saitoella complicata NRRL Y-17804]ODQ50627.1 hypothetical protein SAICODRAFT_67455 [Saitoella complicata NRRL Y-17804]